MDPQYLAIADLTLDHEGGFSTVASDPGNWTSGVVGRGKLAGTKFGISAAAFPTLDIANLTRDQAIAIYKPLYYDKAGCPNLPAGLALLVFDAAVNNGVGRAARWLQASAGATPDGLLGTATFGAINLTLARPDGLVSLSAEFQTVRLLFMASLSTWATFGRGWARRLCRLPFQAVRLTPV